MNGAKYGKSETPCTDTSPRALRVEESPRKFTADGAAHSSISALRSNDAATGAIGIDAASRFGDTILLPPHTRHTETEFYQISTIIRRGRIVAIPERLFSASIVSRSPSY